MWLCKYYVNNCGSVLCFVDFINKIILLKNDIHMQSGDTDSDIHVHESITRLQN